MAKNNSIDDVAQQRAHAKLMLTHVYAFSETEAHYRLKSQRKVICGADAPKDFKPAGKKVMPLCDACQQQAQSQLAGWVAEETRNYWRNPSAGRVPAAAPMARKAKPVSEYKQLDLPPEFMPTGAGQPLSRL